MFQGWPRVLGLVTREMKEDAVYPPDPSGSIPWASTPEELDTPEFRDRIRQGIGGADGSYVPRGILGRRELLRMRLSGWLRERLRILGWIFRLLRR